MTSREIENLNLDYIVCQCYEVTLGDIMEAIENGHDTIEAIRHETNASYGCELCQSTLIDKEGHRDVHLDEILEYAKEKYLLFQ
jgi:NAD(P)H-nitrite reductase large subunit